MEKESAQEVIDTILGIAKGGAPRQIEAVFALCRAAGATDWKDEIPPVEVVPEAIVSEESVPEAELDDAGDNADEEGGSLFA